MRVRGSSYERYDVAAARMRARGWRHKLNPHSFAAEVRRKRARALRRQRVWEGLREEYAAGSEVKFTPAGIYAAELKRGWDILRAWSRSIR